MTNFTEIFNSLPTCDIDPLDYKKTNLMTFDEQYLKTNKCIFHSKTLPRRNRMREHRATADIFHHALS